jgi:DNA-binding CsgD family transcriptional regulator
MDQFALPAPCCCGTEHFTEREVGVLRHVAAGLTNEDVAAAMNISGHTVAGYLRTMLNRSQARTRAELVARAYAAGVLVPHVWPPRWSGRRCLTLPGGGANGHGDANGHAAAGSGDVTPATRTAAPGRAAYQLAAGCSRIAHGEP